MTFKRLFALFAALIFLLANAPQTFGDRGSGSGGSDDGGGNAGGDKALTLRVNPAIGVPGGIVAVVLRTYAPRPVRQGQVLVRVVRRARPGKALGLSYAELTKPARPFLSLISAVVYSQRNDSTAQAALDGQPDSQRATMNFQSPTSGINAADGPLAVFKFRLDPSVKPGQTFDLTLDPALTGLADEQGRPIVIEPRADVLTVRAPAAPYLVEADGDKVEPGETAELSVNTYEPFLVSGGRVTLKWDRSIAGGPPAVRLDSRYGRVAFTSDTSRPGKLVVDFESPDSSFNSVPGSLVSITLPISASAAIGTSSPFSLDPAGTWFLNRRGKKMPVRLEHGAIQVR